MNELALFAGAGGGILGGKLLGWRTVCAVEFDPYARSVLMARQNDGCLEPFPIWDDVRTFDGHPWRGRVDVVSGGFPCQDISTAGKGAGITGARSGLWREMARIIGEVGPRFVLVENSPALTSRGLGVVLGDLAELGFDAEWGVLGAVHAGAPHRRNRIWIVANACGRRCSEPDRREIQQPRGAEIVCASSDVGNALRAGQPRPWKSWYASDPAEIGEGEADHAFHERFGNVWGIESPLGRVAHGVAHRVDRLRCLGNGQVPAVVRLAWNLLGPRNGGGVA